MPDLIVPESELLTGTCYCAHKLSAPGWDHCLLCVLPAGWQWPLSLSHWVMVEAGLIGIIIELLISLIIGWPSLGGKQSLH